MLRLFSVSSPEAPERFWMPGFESRAYTSVAWNGALLFVPVRYWA
ncbi:hypothetical protein GCM10020254_70440 [Streptomyces goshikiensis]